MTSSFARENGQRASRRDRMIQGEIFFGIFSSLGIGRAELRSTIMSTNPFQVPACFQIELERRRRERFKRAVLAFVVGTAMLLVGLLIEGCVSEHAKTATHPGN